MSDPAAPAPDLDIVEPRLRRLYDYWQERRGTRRFPARRDIDPLDFAYILGNVMLVDVAHEPVRFRVRLHGSILVDRSGVDLTGKSFEEGQVTDFHRVGHNRCLDMVATAAPAAFRNERPIDGRLKPYEVLWLPLSEDGVRVTMLICALIYRDRR